MKDKLKYYMENYITPLTDRLKELGDDGFVTDFMMTDQGLKCRQSGNMYQPNDVVQLESFRFEEETDPGDDQIAYALRTKDGTIGTAVNAHGVYADERLDEFLMKAQHNIEQGSGGRKAA